MKRPFGVSIVASLTLLSGIVLLYIFELFVVVSVVGGTSPNATSPMLPSASYVPLLLAFVAFALSFMMFSGRRYTWHASMIFWIALIFFFTWCYTYMGVWRYMLYLEGGDPWYQYLSIARILFLPFPFIYAVGCAIYFFTRTPREYFLHRAMTK
ncbi:MAG: hypothetical protein QXF44_00550 [Candidatus Bathyarchaeia archaeon]